METIDPIALSPERPCHVQASQIANGMTIIAASLVLSVITINLISFTTGMYPLFGTLIEKVRENPDLILQAYWLNTFTPLLFLLPAMWGLRLATPRLRQDAPKRSRALQITLRTLVVGYFISIPLYGTMRYFEVPMAGHAGIATFVTWWAALIIGASYARVILTHYQHTRQSRLANFVIMSFCYLAILEHVAETKLWSLIHSTEGTEVDPVVKMAWLVLPPIISFVTIALTTLAFRKTMADRGDIPM